MAGILQVLLAIFKAIPVLEGWWKRLIALYRAQVIAEIRKQNEEAVEEAMSEKDQRPLEEALGSPRAGQPSNYPGVQRRDSIFGVPKPDNNGDG